MDEWTCTYEKMGEITALGEVNSKHKNFYSVKMCVCCCFLLLFCCCFFLGVGGVNKGKEKEKEDHYNSRQ